MSRDRDDDRQQSRMESLNARAVELRDSAKRDEMHRDLLSRKIKQGITLVDPNWGAERLRMNQEVALIRENVKELKPEAWRALGVDDKGQALPAPNECERKIEALRGVEEIVFALEGRDRAKLEFWAQDRGEEKAGSSGWGSRYDHESNTIQITEAVLRDDDPSKALHAYFRGCRQKYQSSVLTKPSAHSEVDAKTLAVWQDAERTYPTSVPTTLPQVLDFLKARFNNALITDREKYAEHQTRQTYKRDDRYD